MANRSLTSEDRIALVNPLLDAHTLGLVTVGRALEDCGFTVLTAETEIRQACTNTEIPGNAGLIDSWMRKNRITVLGFSYRLDPTDGADLFVRLVRYLHSSGLTARTGGRIHSLYFAGLPDTCEQVKRHLPEISGFFYGDESPAETLRVLGVPGNRIPGDIAEASLYDEDRLSFGRDLVRRGDYLAVKPPDHGGYDGFGGPDDRLINRLEAAGRQGSLPLTRAHIGPYLPDRREAVDLFLDWVHRLSASGYLDILSIGTSQLSQSDFNGDWTGKANGGGVPLLRPEEFATVWQVSRPMLVRTYAGTQDVRKLAELYEETIHMAWHTLSLWWFSQLDGRGPNSVLENLRQHVETIRFAAGVGKPFEPNVPHHFAFRGADDVTYVVSAVIAAQLAKSLGIRTLVLQNMLNTPKYTWGVQDLAKSRAMLSLVRELEGPGFSVILQPRGGLDYFSHNPEKAKAQLAAVSALMDDIEPENDSSPGIIHVVGYSEGFRLADPEVVDDSIRITLQALAEYRRLKRKGWVDDMTNHPEVRRRTEVMISEARAVLKCIGSAVPGLLTPEGLYRVFSLGFLPVPHLWNCREEFPAAVVWPTKVIKGAVVIVDEKGSPVPASERLRKTCLNLTSNGGFPND